VEFRSDCGFTHSGLLANAASQGEHTNIYSDLASGLQDIDMC